MHVGRVVSGGSHHVVIVSESGEDERKRSLVGEEVDVIPFVGTLSRGSHCV